MLVQWNKTFKLITCGLFCARKKSYRNKTLFALNGAGDGITRHPLLNLLKLNLGGFMTKIKNTFDSKKEIKQLNISRLFNLQKLELKELEYHMFKKYDKNLAFESLQNILILNSVINKKINGK